MTTIKDIADLAGVSRGTYGEERILLSSVYGSVYRNGSDCINSVPERRLSEYV